jgi:hypothetical protein
MQAESNRSSQGNALDEIMNNLDRSVDDILDSMDLDKPKETATGGNRSHGRISGRSDRGLGIDDEIKVKVRRRIPKLDEKMQVCLQARDRLAAF